MTAWTDEPMPDGQVQRVAMGLRRAWADPRKAPLEGVQFHPESYLTPHGPMILENFLEMVFQHRASAAEMPMQITGTNLEA